MAARSIERTGIPVAPNGFVVGALAAHPNPSILPSSGTTSPAGSSGTTPSETATPSLYQQEQVSTPQGKITVNLTRTGNPNTQGLFQYNPTSIKSNVNFSVPISQTSGNFTTTGQANYTYQLSGKNLIPIQTGGTENVSYNGILIATGSPSGTLTPTTNTVSQPIYGNVSGQNQLIGTLTYVPQVSGGNISLIQTGFKSALVTISGAYTTNVFGTPYQVGYSYTDITSYNASTNTISFTPSALFATPYGQAPLQIANLFLGSQNISGTTYNVQTSPFITPKAVTLNAPAQSYITTSGTGATASVALYQNIGGNYIPTLVSIDIGGTLGIITTNEANKGAPVLTISGQNVFLGQNFKVNGATYKFTGTQASGFYSAFGANLIANAPAKIINLNLPSSVFTVAGTTASQGGTNIPNQLSPSPSQIVLNGKAYPINFGTTQSANANIYNLINPTTTVKTSYTTPALPALENYAQEGKAPSLISVAQIVGNPQNFFQQQAVTFTITTKSGIEGKTITISTSNQELYPLQTIGQAFVLQQQTQQAFGGGNIAVETLTNLAVSQGNVGELFVTGHPLEAGGIIGIEAATAPLALALGAIGTSAIGVGIAGKAITGFIAGAAISYPTTELYVKAGLAKQPTPTQLVENALESGAFVSVLNVASVVGPRIGPRITYVSSEEGTPLYLGLTFKTGSDTGFGIIGLGKITTDITGVGEADTGVAGLAGRTELIMGNPQATSTALEIGTPEINPADMSIGEGNNPPTTITNPIVREGIIKFINNNPEALNDIEAQSYISVLKFLTPLRNVESTQPQEFITNAKTLSEEGNYQISQLIKTEYQTNLVNTLTGQNVELYGSSAFYLQFPKEVTDALGLSGSHVGADLDIQFKGADVLAATNQAEIILGNGFPRLENINIATPTEQPITSIDILASEGQQILAQTEAGGARISPESSGLVEVRQATGEYVHALDIHGYSEDIDQSIPETPLGYTFRNPLNVENVLVMKASDILTTKASAALTPRITEEGETEFTSAAYRTPKDILGTITYAETLAKQGLATGQLSSSQYSDIIGNIQTYAELQIAKGTFTPDEYADFTPSEGGAGVVKGTPTGSPSTSLGTIISSPSSLFSPSSSSIFRLPPPSTSPSPSRSISKSISLSISRSISPSRSYSASLSPSLSKSISQSISPSRSPSTSISPSKSSSISISPSRSQSSSISPSKSPSLSISPSKSPSFSISPSKSPSLSIPPRAGSRSLSPSFSYPFASHPFHRKPQKSIAPPSRIFKYIADLGHTSLGITGTKSEIKFATKFGLSRPLQRLGTKRSKK